MQAPSWPPYVLALALVASQGKGSVALAQRRHDLGKLYLSLGWPAAALAQADKARDVNKQLLVEEDLTDDAVSETEALHPRILLLNAQAQLSLGNGKKARCDRLLSTVQAIAPSPHCWCIRDAAPALLEPAT